MVKAKYLYRNKIFVFTNGTLSSKAAERWHPFGTSDN